VKLPYKRIPWLLLGISLWLHAEPVEVVVTGTQSWEDARKIEKRLSKELGKRLQGVAHSVTKVQDLWLIRLGPLERKRMLKQGILERLGGLGYHPIVLSKSLRQNSSKRSSVRSSAKSSQKWQWILWGILGGGLLIFIIRRGRSTRQLLRSQDRLEERQKRLERAIEQEGGAHG